MQSGHSHAMTHDVTIEEVITDEYIYHFELVEDRITAVTRYDADDFIECQPGERYTDEYEIDRLCWSVGVDSNFDRMFDAYIEQCIEASRMEHDGGLYLHQPRPKPPTIGPDDDIPFGPAS